MFDEKYWKALWNKIKKFLRNPFRSDLIEEEGSLYLLDSLGIPSNHHIIAFASTGRSHPIIFTINDLVGRKKISMNIWDSKSSLDSSFKSTFTPSSKNDKSNKVMGGGKRSKYRLVPNIVDIGSDGIIVNVIPMDFNYDGVLDLLLVIKTNDPHSSFPVYRNEIWHGHLLDDEISFKLVTRLPNTISSQIVPVDYYGKMEINLIVFTSREPTLLTRQPNGLYKQDRIEMSERCQLSQPSWIIVQDLDGDAIPEIIMTCGSFRPEDDTKKESLKNGKSGSGSPVAFIDIWSTKGMSNGTMNGYKLVDRKPMSSKLSHLFFADVDGDGRADMIYLLNDPPGSSYPTNELHLIHNRGTIANSNENDNQKRDYHSGLLSKNDSFSFDMKDPKYHQIIQIDHENMPLDRDPFTNEPVPIRVGDFNLDGHPDLLWTLKSGKINLLQATMMADSSSSTVPSWTFEPVTGDPVKVLNDQSDAIHAAFVDISSLSTIFINHQRGNSIIANGIYRDTFFLSAECLQFPYSKRSKSIIPISQMPGTTFKIRFINQSGKKCIRVSSQGSSFSYMPLSNPKTIFGLGTTNNYIEEFLTGVNHRHVTKTNIFPNSELIIYSPTRDDNGNDRNERGGNASPNGDWYVELHINPAAYFYYVLASLIISIVALGVITAVLKWRENREDEKERRSAGNILLGRF